MFEHILPMTANFMSAAVDLQMFEHFLMLLQSFLTFLQTYRDASGDMKNTFWKKKISAFIGFDWATRGNNGEGNYHVPWSVICFGVLDAHLFWF